MNEAWIQDINWQLPGDDTQLISLLNVGGEICTVTTFTDSDFYSKMKRK